MKNSNLLMTAFCALALLFALYSMPAPARAAMSDADFLEVCAGGTPEEVERAIKAGANPAARDDEGATPLHRAAFNQNPDVARVFLENGADPNAVDNSGTTPLMRAAGYNEVPVLSLLLEAGAEVNAQNKYGLSALMIASQRNDGLPVVAFLLENGADALAVDERGRDALSFAAWQSLHPEELGLLIKHGADVNSQNIHGGTALMRAASSGRVRNIKNILFLLDNGADAGLTDKDGKKAMDYLPASKPDDGDLSDEDWEMVQRRLKGE